MERCELLAGTADGMLRLAVGPDGKATVISHGLQGQAIRGIAWHHLKPETMFVAAGLRGWGLHVTHDGGNTFRSLGFEDHWCWDIAIDEANPDRLLLGTEPPMLWESLDAGNSWRSFPAIDQVESRANWTFFHAPFHSGHLHGIALSRHRPHRILVGVEHGGLLRSTDDGETWIDVMPGADLHRITIHPENPDRIYAGTGSGLFLSFDGGQKWKIVSGLGNRYVHGIVIDPDDSRTMFVYVDSTQCPIYRSSDAGESWEPVGAGLPSSRPADPVCRHPESAGTVYYAGDKADGSTLYVSEDSGDNWRRIELELPKVWRLKEISGQKASNRGDGSVAGSN
jgi:hypothetical protein